MMDRRAQLRRARAITLVAAAALPFWAAVAYLGPLGAMKPSPRQKDAPAVTTSPRRSSVGNCFRRQQELQQSLQDCPAVIRPRVHRPLHGPGDFPLRGLQGELPESALAGDRSRPALPPGS